MVIYRAHLFSLAVVILLQCFTYMKVTAQSTSITTDQSALIALKSQLHLSSSHILSSNWSRSTHVCTWIGVSCGHRHQRVTALDISSMGVAGNLPPEIGNLSFIASINLSDNTFRGSLPQEMNALRRLQFLDLTLNEFMGELPSWFHMLPELDALYLGNNSFTGVIPNSIGNMSEIQILDLSYNSLHGEVPKEIGSANTLQVLELQYNQLSGLIPAELFNISNMERLSLTGNSFAGVLPADLCRGGASKLQKLSLSRNELEGQIPSSISECSQLRRLSLSFNKFTGPIPKEIGNLTALEILYLGANHLTGQIPDEIGECKELYNLDLGANNIGGTIPRSIGNLTLLHKFDISENNLTGTIIQELGNCHSLEVVDLSVNRLLGPIPLAILNISTLSNFYAGINELSGSLPPSFGYGIPNLQDIDIGENLFTGSIPESISNCSRLTGLLFFNNGFNGLESNIITSLTKCRNLENIVLSGNPLNGALPASIGMFSSSLQRFYMGASGLIGSIPYEIGNITNLISLILDINQLSGPIPHTMGNLQKLQRLNLFSNKLTGTLSESLCKLGNRLGELLLDQNQITGPVLDCIGNFNSLRVLSMAKNNLTSKIPMGLWQLNNILEVNLSSNFLDGSLPLDIQNLKVVISVDLSANRFSGILPNTIGYLQNLQTLSLAYNYFNGTIPQSMGASLVDLQTLVLSHNNLSGEIPISLEGIQTLTYFDVSFNELSGRIPTDGPFQHFGSQFFMSNDGLCGDPRFGVPVCVSKEGGGSNRRKVEIRVICGVVSVMLLAFAIILATVLFTRHQRRKAKITKVDLSIGTSLSRFSYYDIRNATEGFSDKHLVGVGGSSSVYKGTLQNGKVVAIKVLNLQLECAFRNFTAECDVLRSLRHRNLCEVISVCSNESFKAIVLEFMPNRSLEMWLYSQDCFLNIMQRVDITLDVACALEYLHHGNLTQVVHCDVKPGNVLLDEDMVSHLSDFGIAKLLRHNGEGFAQTTTLATLGYIAPEYGSEGLVSTRCDVYSYGIMMMEVFTRIKPVGETFDDNFNLRKLVFDSWPDEIVRIIDPELLSTEEEYFTEKLECLSSIMKIALGCSVENPSERLCMKDVVVKIKNIKLQLLPYVQEPRRVRHVNQAI